MQVHTPLSLDDLPTARSLWYVLRTYLNGMFYRTISIVCSIGRSLQYVLQNDLYGMFFGMISMVCSKGRSLWFVLRHDLYGLKKIFLKNQLRGISYKEERKKKIALQIAIIINIYKLFKKFRPLFARLLSHFFSLSLLLLPDPDLIPSYLPTISLASSFLHSLSLLLIFLRPLSVNIFNLIFSKFVWFTNTLAFVSTSIWAVASKTSPYSLMLDLNPIH